VPPLAPRIGLDSFVARAADVRAVASLLAEARVLTVTGPGGVGKSRFAAQIAQTVQTRFADGVVCADLSTALDAADVPRLVMDACAVAGRPDQDMLVRHFESLDVLLVLDNCERVLAACAELALALAQCARLRVLLTSRAALRIRGERVWPLAPLARPRVDASFEEMAASEAVQLFVERTREVDPAFEVTHENAPILASICRRLDGLPLALELAAARLNLLSVAQLDVELGHSLDLLEHDSGSPGRHRTLRGSLDDSLALVSESAQRLFRRLSVLAGPWTLDAARLVCTDAQLPAATVLPLLADLVDVALIQAQPGTGSTHFSLLETSRRYALHLLDATGEAATYHDRHAAWCVGMSARLNMESPCAAARGAVAHYQSELPEALDWVLEQRIVDVDAALALANALHLAGTPGNVGADALARLERILATDEGDSRARGFAWCRAAAHARHQGAVHKAFDYLARATAEPAAASDISLQALIQQTTAEVHADRGDLAAAWDAWQELREAGASGRSCCWARATAGMATVCLERGDVEAANALIDGNLSALEDPMCESAPGGILTLAGRVAMARGDLKRATWSLTRAFEAAQSSDDAIGMADALRGQIELALERGQPTTACGLAKHLLALAPDVHGLLDRIRMLESCALALAAPRGVPLAHAATGLRLHLGFERSPAEQTRLARLARSPRDAEPLPLGAALELARHLLSDEDAAQDTERVASHLTRREMEVARRVALGQSTREVADALVISEGTVRAHVEHIRTKLGLASRAEIAPLLGLRRS
jgi:non-specific serine/threonine protein kinase